ncbi:hypothetical protein BCAH1134_A0062 [Bacillus cereus AH1134]|nr:hypothetical protein BCAH1134_A0062 [Bacillus cereus AH1134]
MMYFAKKQTIVIPPVQKIPCLNLERECSSFAIQAPIQQPMIANTPSGTAIFKNPSTTCDVKNVAILSNGFIFFPPISNSVIIYIYIVNEYGKQINN